MSFLETLMGGNHEVAIEQIAQKLGVNPADVQSAMSQLMPMLAQGFKQQAAGGAAPALMQAIQDPAHAQAAASPATLAVSDAGQGMEVAHQLLGGREQALAVADHLAQATGLNPEKLKAMLPMAASLFAGTVARQAEENGGGLKGLMGAFQNVKASAVSGGVLGTLNTLLDANKDGSAVDDILGFFKNRVA